MSLTPTNGPPLYSGNTVGGMVSRVLAAGERVMDQVESFLPAAKPTPDRPSTYHPDSLSHRVQRVEYGPLFPLIKAVMSRFPLTRYDTPAIKAERVRDLEVIHDSLRDTGRLNTMEIPREDFREQVIEHILNNGVDERKHERQAWFIVAPMAAGKSTISPGLAKDHGALDLDRDQALDAIPEWKTTTSMAYTSAERRYIINEVTRRALDGGDNVIFSSTHNEHSLEQMLRTLKAHDYTVHLIHLDLPGEKAVERVMDPQDGRWAKTGRFSDPVGLLLGPDWSRRAYQNLKHRGDLVADYKEYSTDVPRGTAPRLLEEGTNP